MREQGIALRRESREVAHGSETLQLNVAAFRLLEVLAQEPGRVVTLSKLGEALRGITAHGAEVKVVGRSMRDLTRKLNRVGCQHIVAVHGVGYAFFSGCSGPTSVVEGDGGT